MLTVWLCGMNFTYVMLEQRTAQVRQLQSMKLVTMSQLTNSFSVDAQTEQCHILLVWDCLACSQISGMGQTRSVLHFVICAFLTTSICCWFAMSNFEHGWLM